MITDVLDLTNLELICGSLPNIPLTTKGSFTYFNKDYRKIYCESKLNYSSIFSNDNDTEFCKLVINFVFGGIDVEGQIKFLEV